MVFSSLAFLFAFLPLTYFLYRATPNLKAQNGLLIIASLLFYAYGEPVYVLLMVFSTLLNYASGILVSQGKTPRQRKTFLALAITLNLALLGIFKYSDMLALSVSQIPGITIPAPQIILPIGISFFTFQAMSYVIDVYRGQVRAESNYLNVLLYISFFPQLIAGPIVKYHDIARQIHDRRCSLDETARGLRRFCFGLAKKVLLANQCAAVCDALYSAPSSDLNILTSWLAALSYLLQIYFDFSGYSDMAIGLGHMFGFSFKENFNYPYTAKSIQEFWRRWHISLSTWFLQYVYIPLGGNRKGRARTCANKLIVFFLCGLWHGASWTFVAWGLYHGLFLLLEEYVPRLRQLPAPLGHVYALLVIVFGWVLFRANSFSQAAEIMGLMLTGFTFTHAQVALLLQQLTPKFVCAFGIGLIACLPVRNVLERRFARSSHPFAGEALSFALAFMLLALCVLELSSGGYNPFIYFRF
ncbi:MAG: MBOAT family protein [Eggerthellaceae bacterium]|nr:MBOAT family protein [Eggerthellaceae bacterium]